MKHYVTELRSLVVRGAYPTLKSRAQLVLDRFSDVIFTPA